MNMLSRTFSEGGQNRSSTDSRGSPMSTTGTVSAVAAPCSLDLDFLIGKTMRRGSNDATSGPGRGDGGRSLTPADELNGTLKALLTGA
jgi:hypothetical protein